MRYIFLVAIFLICPPAFGQQACDALLKDFQSTNAQIADIEAERALTESFRTMTSSLNSAIEDLNEAKGEAQAYEDKLKDLEKLLGNKFEQFGAAVSGTKAGTKKLKTALGDTADGLSDATAVFALYREKLKKGDNRNPAETLQALADSYDVLQGALGPLIDKVPVIGQFLEGYGEAIKSAAIIATKLQKTRNEQAATVDKIPELNGGNPFRFPTEKDNKLKKLQAQAKLQLVAVKANNCAEPRKEEPTVIYPEVVEAKEAARLQCLKEMNLKEEPYDTYIDALGDLDEIKASVELAQLARSEAQSELSQLSGKPEEIEKKNKSKLTGYTTSLATLKRQTEYSQFIARVRNSGAPRFPSDPTKFECSIASDVAATFGQNFLVVLKNYCSTYTTAKIYLDQLQKARAALDRAKQTFVTADANYQSSLDRIVQIRNNITKADENRDKFTDCINKNNNPIDISGRYWIRETKDILVIKRVGPNYAFRYETPSSNEASLRGVKKGDEWFIGRLNEGKLKGRLRQRFPLSVQTEWGCPNSGSWVTGEAKVWSGGEWLSFFTDTLWINESCKIRKAGDVFNAYKEGTKLYQDYYRP